MQNVSQYNCISRLYPLRTQDNEVQKKLSALKLIAISIASGLILGSMLNSITNRSAYIKPCDQSDDVYSLISRGNAFEDRPFALNSLDAAHCYTLAADLGSDFAVDKIATLSRGLRRPQRWTDQQVAGYLEKAAQRGSAQAQYNFADFLHSKAIKGITAKNFAFAFKPDPRIGVLYKAAADQGHTEAAYRYRGFADRKVNETTIYHELMSGEERESVKYLLIAADHNHVEAQRELIDAYTVVYNCIDNTLHKKIYNYCCNVIKQNSDKDGMAQQAIDIMRKNSFYIAN